MTYRELLYKAQRLINHNEITLGEYDEMTKPLNEEVRKVGTWIDYWGDKTESDGEAWWSGCKCSECGIFIKQHYNYCPNCGSEMRGNENE